MSAADLTIHVTFYEERTERSLGSVDALCPPAVGDIVWCSWHDGYGSFEVVKRQWSHVMHGSTAWMRGERGGMLDCLVRSCGGLFAASVEGNTE